MNKRELLSKTVLKLIKNSIIMVVMIALLAMLLTAASIMNAYAIPSESKQINKIIDNALKSHQEAAKLQSVYHSTSNKLTDEVFVKRAYLVIAGRLPIYEETIAFLNNNSTKKREKLISKLLKTADFKLNYYNFLSDILRIQPSKDKTHLAFTAWLFDSIARNVPYNKLVRSLLVAKGSPYDNPASFYLLQDHQMPLERAGFVSQAFLGTRIGCAQCHDHKFEKWTQQNFYQYAAFLTQAKKVDYLNNRKMRKSTFKLKTLSPVQQAKVTRFLRKLPHYLDDVKDSKLKYPFDYVYSDKLKNQVVAESVLFGTYQDDSSKTIRENFANWIVSDKNPRFALTIASRLWKWTMGRGIVEPEDELYDNQIIANPQLWAYLEKLMLKKKFNVKEFLNVILNTDVFSQKLGFSELIDNKNYVGQSFIKRRMTAYQLWDSLQTIRFATKKSIEILPYQQDEILIYSDAYNKVTAIHKKILDSKVSDNKNNQSKKKKKRENKKMWESYSKEMFAAILKIEAEHEKKLKALKALKSKNNKNMKKKYANKIYMPSAYLHATLLLKPSRTKYLNEVLSLFGRSDRATISHGSTEAEIPHAFYLMNSKAMYQLFVELNRDKELGKIFSNKSGNTLEQKIERMYLTLLSRQPTTEETALWVAFYQDPNTRQRLNSKYFLLMDLVWTLSNIHEFKFIL